MDFPYGVTVTFRARSVDSTDDYGDDVASWTETDVDGCAFDPGSSSELVQGQDTVVRNPAVYVPAGVVLPAAVDEVVVGGVTYRVDGQPAAWSSPFTGVAFGGVVRLENVTG